VPLPRRLTNGGLSAFSLRTGKPSKAPQEAHLTQGVSLYDDIA